MATGKIQSYNPEKGFAFIRPDQGGDDVFLHRSAVAGDFAAMGEGQVVEYDLDSKSERPRAKRAVPQGSPPPSRPRSSRPGAPRSAGNSRPPLNKKRSAGAPAGPDARRRFERPGNQRRSTDRPPQRRGRNDAPRPPVENCVRGFVTKQFRHEEPHGFISLDSGGHEVRFEPRAVTGRDGFVKLRVGDYVECLIKPDSADTREPVATYVNRIERPLTTRSLQLSRHPKARKKKPSWRS